MSDSRLSELEAKYAWLERHVADQDKVIFSLGEEIRRIRRECDQLRAAASNRAGSGEPESPEPPPPHY